MCACATVGCDLRFAYRFEAKPLHTRRRQAQCAQGRAALCAKLSKDLLCSLISFEDSFFPLLPRPVSFSSSNRFVVAYYCFFENEMLTHNPKLWANLHRRFELSSDDCFRVHAIHA